MKIYTITAVLCLASTSLATHGFNRGQAREQAQSNRIEKRSEYPSGVQRHEHQHHKSHSEHGLEAHKDGKHNYHNGHSSSHDDHDEGSNHDDHDSESHDDHDEKSHDDAHGDDDAHEKESKETKPSKGDEDKKSDANDDGDKKKKSGGGKKDAEGKKGDDNKKGGQEKAAVADGEEKKGDEDKKGGKNKKGQEKAAAGAVGDEKKGDEGTKDNGKAPAAGDGAVPAAGDGAVPAAGDGAAPANGKDNAGSPASPATDAASSNEFTSPLWVVQPFGASVWEQGRAYVISWGPNPDPIYAKKLAAKAPVDIRLMQGPPEHLKEVAMLKKDTDSSLNSFQWTVPTTLALAKDYSIRLTHEGQVDTYSHYFEVVKAGDARSSKSNVGEPLQLPKKGDQPQPLNKGSMIKPVAPPNPFPSEKTAAKVPPVAAKPAAHKSAAVGGIQHANVLALAMTLFGAVYLL
ncbi:hypothetical protein BG004_000455 [Podila humilis]|nr:hypothetical protein BG004_000455 [Podila humilis]